MRRDDPLTQLRDGLMNATREEGRSRKKADLHRLYLSARTPDRRDALWQAILELDAEGPYLPAPTTEEPKR